LLHTTVSRRNKTQKTRIIRSESLFAKTTGDTNTNRE
jgi:hypothetical protein